METSKTYLESPAPYLGYRVYGPRVENTGRRSVSLYNPTNAHQFTMTTARYIMSVYTGEVLPRSVHVDHIDGNPHNEDVCNLQMLNAKSNLAKGSHDGSYTRITISAICPWCSEPFTRLAHPTSIAANSLTFCSRSHSTLFYHKASRDADGGFERKKHAASINNVHKTQRVKNLDYNTNDAVAITSVPDGLHRVLDFLSRTYSPHVRERRKCACGNELPAGKTYCSSPCKVQYAVPRKTLAPNRDTLVSLLQSLNYSQIGRAYGVSPNAVKKWAVKYGI